MLYGGTARADVADAGRVRVPGEPRLVEPLRRALPGRRAHRAPRTRPPRGGRPAGGLRRAAAALRLPGAGRPPNRRSRRPRCRSRCCSPCWLPAPPSPRRRRGLVYFIARIHGRRRRGRLVCAVPHRPRRCSTALGDLRAVRPAVPRRSAGREAVGEAAAAGVAGRRRCCSPASRCSSSSRTSRGAASRSGAWRCCSRVLNLALLIEARAAGLRWLAAGGGVLSWLVLGAWWASGTLADRRSCRRDLGHRRASRC